MPASRVRQLSEVIDEGQPAARDLLAPLPVGSAERSVSLPGIGFRLNGDSLLPSRSPGEVGRDNDRWLEDE
ncbi:MAG TPA: hypothetical protein DDZ38_02120 [Gammaproteobacteria bacterium]|nr:hypothetical protein [Gammaproteobacteria bacterium]